MATSPDDAGQCQRCEDADAETTVVASIGGIPAGPVFVCEPCETELAEGSA